MEPTDIQNIPETPEVPTPVPSEKSSGWRSAFSMLDETGRYIAAIIFIAGLGGGIYLFANRPFRAAELPVAVATSTPSAFDSINITGKAAYVIDLTDNKVLYNKNGEAQL